MKKLTSIFVLFYSIALNLVGGDLESMYEPVIIESGASEFVAKFPKFKWIGANKRVAVSTESSLFDTKVREAVAYFNSEDKMLRLDAWIYNRGDDGDKSEEQFEKDYKEILTRLADHFKMSYKMSNVSGPTKSRAYTFSFNRDYSVSLLVGFKEKPYRADFIALVARNHDAIKRKRGTEKLAKFVTTKKNGDVIIDKIPMIDQGPKGYCVPATLARIGQHYGVDISMHEIAMIADSESSAGTSILATLNALKKHYSRIRLKIKDIRIDPPGVYIVSNGWLKTISSSHAQSLSESIKDDDSKLKKFRKQIVKSVDSGLIIAWTMVVGLLPENGEPALQSGGGHMRIIIGYNKQTDEVIFSDSWGPGHEVKRMPFKSAFIVTSGLHEVKSL